MAIPGIPNNFNVSQGNGQVLTQWNISAGATSYSVQRSIDGVNYTSIATPTATQYVDTSVSLGVQYWYQVASVNVSGTSPYTVQQSIIPTPTGEMSLAELRTRSLQRADRLNSNFVTLTELNSYINQSYFELYDLLVGVYEDYFLAPPVFFTLTGNQYFYPIPDGSNTFQNYLGQDIIPPPLYKLYGVDLALQNANNAFVTVNKFMFSDRNSFIYPNSASTIFGVFNLRYRMLSQGIEFIPTPSANQRIRIHYVPRMKELLLDTDTTIAGVSGWTEYLITDVAIKILMKEESDVSVLAAQKQALILRIEAMASNRDQAEPDRISDSRKNHNSGWGDDSGSNSSMGGW